MVLLWGVSIDQAFQILCLGTTPQQQQQQQILIANENISHFEFLL